MWSLFFQVFFFIFYFLQKVIILLSIDYFVLLGKKIVKSKSRPEQIVAIYYFQFYYGLVILDQEFGKTTYPRNFFQLNICLDIHQGTGLSSVSAKMALYFSLSFSCEYCAEVVHSSSEMILFHSINIKVDPHMLGWKFKVAWSQVHLYK